MQQKTEELEQLIQSINKLYLQADYRQVIFKCNIGLLEYPHEKHIFLYNKAIALDILRKNSAAKKCIDELLRMNPKHDEALCLKAQYSFDEYFKYQNKKYGKNLSVNLLEKIQIYADYLIQSNKNLIDSISIYSEKLETYLKYAEHAIQYQKSLQQELQKKEINPDQQIDFRSINFHLRNLLSNKDDFKVLKSFEKEEIEMKNKFPKGYTVFVKLFQYLCNLENVICYETQLECICLRLGFKYDFLKLYYELEGKLKQSADICDSNKKMSYEISDSTELTNSTENPTDSNDFDPPTDRVSDSKVKTLAQVLYEIDCSLMKKSLNKDQYNQMECVGNYDYVRMEKCFDNYQIKSWVSRIKSIDNYSYSWFKVSSDKRMSDVEMKKTIQDWTEKTKKNACKLNNDEGINEAIAMLNIAYSLTSQPPNLNIFERYPILVSLFVLLETPEKGKILQIGAGQGKSSPLVPFFVIIKALMGKKVDVITSNDALSKEDREKNKNFYQLMGFKVATNISSLNDPSIYTDNDIVYGIMRNFQLDYLRGNRKKESLKETTVLLDEENSVLLDNAENQTYLFEPLPNIERLNDIFIKIWTELNAEKNVCEKKLETIKKIKNTIDLAEFNLMPYLQEYAKIKLTTWINNAFEAKYLCKKNREYVIKNNSIFPVDFLYTGMLQKEKIFPDGLQQFIQLKENLPLTCLILPYNYVSNISYIKMYENLFALTATLGSELEKNFLADNFQVSLQKIPSYKDISFVEYPIQRVSEADLYRLVVTNTLTELSKQRAVLIICQTIEDVCEIKKKLELVKKMIKEFLEPKIQRILFDSNDEINQQIKDSFELVEKMTWLAQSAPIQVLTDDDNFDDDKDKLEFKPGTVQISTNCAERVTNFKTTQEVENNGGLHVIIAQLPINERAQLQAFGRTSRAGLKGSDQIITVGDDIFNDFDRECSIETYIRNEKEKARINKIKKFKLPEIFKQDNIFASFAELIEVGCIFLNFFNIIV